MPPINPFVELTAEFNAGGVRAIVCSVQAVVLHRVAMMSKDGDWIVREEEEALRHIRGILASHGARYRYGAPLEARWLAGGWSAHLEFRRPDGVRVRTDFFSRPPRLSEADLAALWEEQGTALVPFIGLRDLARMKMTQREKDYPIIGELARRMPEIDQLHYSRSPRDLLRLVGAHPQAAAAAVRKRPLLAWAMEEERERLSAALDMERRDLMMADEKRLAHYQQAAEKWLAAWPRVESRAHALPLDPAHAMIVGEAEKYLPFNP